MKITLHSFLLPISFCLGLHWLFVNVSSAQLSTPIFIDNLEVLDPAIEQAVSEGLQHYNTKGCEPMLMTITEINNDIYLFFCASGALHSLAMEGEYRTQPFVGHTMLGCHHCWVFGDSIVYRFFKYDPETYLLPEHLSWMTTLKDIKYEDDLYQEKYWSKDENGNWVESEGVPFCITYSHNWCILKDGRFHRLKSGNDDYYKEIVFKKFRFRLPYRPVEK